MLTLTDCVAFSGLTRDQLEAVADHQHLPTILAAEWAETMLERIEGWRLVEAVLTEEASIASCRGDGECANRYRSGLEEFRRSCH
jgi:hypothetical protein